MQSFVIWDANSGKVTSLDDRRVVGLTREYCHWYGRKPTVRELEQIEARLQEELAAAARSFLRGREPTGEAIALIHELEMASVSGRSVVPVKLVRLDYHTPYRPEWDREEVWQPLDVEQETARWHNDLAIAG